MTKYTQNSKPITQHNDFYFGFILLLNHNITQRLLFLFFFNIDGVQYYYGNDIISIFIL
jgi:hypothetical protein